MRIPTTRQKHTIVIFIVSTTFAKSQSSYWIAFYVHQSTFEVTIKYIAKSIFGHFYGFVFFSISLLLLFHIQFTHFWNSNWYFSHHVSFNYNRIRIVRKNNKESGKIGMWFSGSFKVEQLKNICLMSIYLSMCIDRVISINRKLDSCIIFLFRSMLNRISSV